MTQRQVLTPTEVAALLRVRRSTVIDWASTGKLKSFKTPTGRYRFLRDDVDAVLGESSVVDGAA